MIVKKKTIGSGKPLLCVPVTDETTSGIVESINRLSTKRVDAIEWRADHYKRCDSPQMVSAVLQEVEGLLQETVLIFTCRTAAEGGKYTASKEEYEALLMAAAQTGVPDFIDLEFEKTKELPMLLQVIRSGGVRVISSYHNFTQTPPTGKMIKKYREMFSAGADIAKIAVMPEDFGDVCDLLEASRSAADLMKADQGLIAISMGQSGAVSRLTGEVTGSCLTFVTDGAPSAPGQMSYEKVNRALDAIHACVTEGIRK